jgi:DNA invertase Pin-like site-specific DNA recombinase
VIAFLYARVSTSDKGQDPAMQLREMQEFSGRRGWTTEIFSDAGYSGSKLNRPELDRMMTLARRRKCDVVVVYRFDRFARSLKQLLDALAEFDALGIQFVSLHEQVDTTTPAGRLLFQIIGGIAEFERSLIRERVCSGLAHARSKGIRLGRPRRVADVQKIRSLRAKGETWERVARLVGVSRATAVRLLKSSQKPISGRRSK